MSSNVSRTKGLAGHLVPPSLLFLFLLLIFMIYSCQKSSHEGFSPTETAEVAVNIWLDSKKNNAASDRNQRVEQIRNLLDFSASHTEMADSGKTFLVIPLKAGFESAYNRDKNTRNYLLLTKARNGKIEKGNIVQVINDAVVIPDNTFNAIETLKKVKIDAGFTFLTIFDRYLYSVSYKNNFITSFTEARKKLNAEAAETGISTNSLQTNAPVCTDWYLRTTYYYSDGTTEVMESYIGRTCTGGCLPNEWCDVPPGDEGGGGGDGGGGDPDNVDYEYDKKRDLVWIVYQNPGIVRVESIETVRGKANNEPTQGVFTSASHKQSFITGDPYNWHWQETLATTNVSGSTATFSVSGQLKQQFFDWATKSNSVSTTYSACFP